MLEYKPFEPKPEHDLAAKKLEQLMAQRESSKENSKGLLETSAQALHGELLMAEQGNPLVQSVMQYIKRANPGGSIVIAEAKDTPEAEVSVPHGIKALVITENGFRIEVGWDALTRSEAVSIATHGLYDRLRHFKDPRNLQLEDSSTLRAVSARDLLYFPIHFTDVADRLTEVTNQIIDRDQGQ